MSAFERICPHLLVAGARRCLYFYRHLTTVRSDRCGLAANNVTVKQEGCGRS
jgi:hypothetical protein